MNNFNFQPMTIRLGGGGKYVSPHVDPDKLYPMLIPRAELERRKEVEKIANNTFTIWVSDAVGENAMSVGGAKNLADAQEIGQDAYAGQLKDLPGRGYHQNLVILLANDGSSWWHALYADFRYGQLDWLECTAEGGDPIEVDSNSRNGQLVLPFNVNQYWKIV